MRTRGEIAEGLMWLALIGFMAVGITQGWDVSQIIMGGLGVCVVVFALHRWATR